jgi:hypothetical protein
MGRLESGTSSGVRAVECAIMVALVLSAGDTLRLELAPLWRALRLVLGS